jgi:hypothetical protein
MTDAARDAIREQFGDRPFRVREAVAAGVPRHVVYRLRDEGVLLSLSRGVMQSADSDPAMNAEFAAVAARAPKATICLNSGLSYGLADLGSDCTALERSAPGLRGGRTFRSAARSSKGSSEHRNRVTAGGWCRYHPISRTRSRRSDRGTRLMMRSCFPAAPAARLIRGRCAGARSRPQRPGPVCPGSGFTPCATPARRC